MAFKFVVVSHSACQVWRLNGGPASQRPISAPATPASADRLWLGNNLRDNDLNSAAVSVGGVAFRFELPSRSTDRLRKGRRGCLAGLRYWGVRSQHELGWTFDLDGSLGAAKRFSSSVRSVFLDQSSTTDRQPFPRAAVVTASSALRRCGMLHATCSCRPVSVSARPRGALEPLAQSQPQPSRTAAGPARDPLATRGTRRPVRQQPSSAAVCLRLASRR